MNICEERSILKLATPFLEELYGSFEIDPHQLDDPDAAIILKQNSTESKLETKEIRIGIEITIIDKQKNLQYLNDEKVTKNATLDQVEALLKDGSYSKQPMKKLLITFPKEYIYEGIFKKKDKYAKYMQTGGYDEIIILAFSSHLHVNQEYIENYLKPWSEFLLSEQAFPFDKAIFVCKTTKKPILVYDKSRPQLNRPQQHDQEDVGTEVIQSSILPTGVTINMFDIFEQDPLIPSKKNKT